MPYLMFFGLLGALMFSFPVLASEDMESVMFGAEAPVETAAPAVEAAPVSSMVNIENSAPVEEYPEEMDFMDGENEANIWGEEGQPPAPVNAAAVSDGQAQSPAAAASSAPVSQTAEQNVTETAPVPQIKKGQDLTDTLKNDQAQAAPKIPLPKVEGTWVDKLATANPLEILNAEKNNGSELEKLVNDARQDNKQGRKSNASVFDISGVMLRMSLPQVDDTMKNRGFQKIMQKHQIPNFIKWRNEEYCRSSGVIGYERTQACVVQKAKKDSHEYVQTAKYAKYDTKEEIEVTFTSNFTENKVYKIEYTSMASSITGNSQKAVYLRNIKIYDFWKKINQKYGKPDDKEAVTWGMGGNKPYLKAKTGWLLLEDPMLRELDYTRMSREDQRYLNTDLYSF